MVCVGVCPGLGLPIVGDLTQHFSRHEFACKCKCGRDTIDFLTLTLLEDVRDHFNQPITVHSAFRCPAYNAMVNGAENSQHLVGRAVDFVVTGVLPEEVASYLKWRYPGKFGIGSYKSFTHFDTRSGPAARWTG